MAYIGSTPTSQNFIAGTDYFNGTGSQTAFTLTRSVNSVNDIEVTINNVVQQPNSYTVSGTTLTISAAPSSGTSNVYVRYLSTTLQSITVPNNSITYAQLDSNVQADIQGRNRIINGSMVVDQRNAGASLNPADGAFSVDRWKCAVYPTTGKYTVQQNAGSVTPPTGFTNYLGITSSSAYTSGSTDQYFINQRIEGFNFADLGWGTANAKTVTLSFWVYSSLATTFGGSIINSAGNRAYPFSYTTTATNTWQQISITITGETTGSWGTTNNIGALVVFNLGCGSATAGTAGAWVSAERYTVTGSTNLLATNGATLYLTGVQLEVGSSATGYEYRLYNQELLACQRYYQQFGNQTSGSGIFGSGYIDGTTQGRVYTALKVTMRSAPTVSVSSASHFSNQNNSVTAAGTSFSTYKQTADSIAYILTSSGGGMYAGQGCLIIDNSTTSAAVYCTSEL
jgi:hypothetical protein